MSNELTSRRSRRGRRRTRAGESAEGRERWLLSYADLVTLLFALFIVLFAAADKERASSIARSVAVQFGGQEQGSIIPQSPANLGILPGVDKLAAEQSAIDQAFASNQTLGSQARVTRTERGIVVSLAEAGFFAPGEAALRSDAISLVDALADALRESQAQLRIEGHTDSTPISNTRYPSNWELSTARAASVLARLTARGVSTSRLAVAGYADERPISDNSTLEGRALNRRVDLVILSQKD